MLRMTGGERLPLSVCALEGSQTQPEFASVGGTPEFEDRHPRRPLSRTAAIGARPVERDWAFHATHKNGQDEL